MRLRFAPAIRARCCRDSHGSSYASVMSNGTGECRASSGCRGFATAQARREKQRFSRKLHGPKKQGSLYCAANYNIRAQTLKMNFRVISREKSAQHVASPSAYTIDLFYFPRSPAHVAATQPSHRFGPKATKSRQEAQCSIDPCLELRTSSTSLS